MITDRLQSIHKALLTDFSLRAHIALEVEFYLHGFSNNPAAEGLWKQLEHECVLQNIRYEKFEKERGPDQFEVALSPHAKPDIAIHDERRFRVLLNEIAGRYELKVDFSAIPIPDEPGSGLHVHAHLENEQGENVFYREEEEYSPLLLHSIGGLLASMEEGMVFFAPHAESYARFKSGGTAPSTISWGPNNRTVAVRLPTKPMANKHIEHRVSGADANVTEAVTTILAGIHYGLSHRINPPPAIYGDAGLPMYALKRLPATLKDAKLAFENATILKSYLD